MLRTLVRTLERSLKVRGVFGTCRHARSVLAERLAALRRGEDLGAKQDAALGEAFDREYGVDTSGMIPASRLDIAGENWVHASAYVPTDPIQFGDVLAGLGLTFEETTFVDLGCGKGRVLLMALALPFRRVVGVDFSPGLCDIARENLRRYRGPRACRDVTVETADVVAYKLPAGALVVFMYHPFDETIMARVVEKLTKSLSEDPRRVVVLYFKPVYAELWDRVGSLHRKHSSELYNLYDSTP